MDLPSLPGTPGGVAPRTPGAPVVPDFGARCITEIIPTLLTKEKSSLFSPFVPPEVLSARQVVLFVLDGLGWLQLNEHRDVVPNLAALSGGPITSVLPTTTATALSSISTGSAPARHGVVGYRVAVGGEVLNVLKWATPKGDVRDSIPPREFQTVKPFFDTRPPIVSRAEFEGSGFTNAHLGNAPLHGWRMPSSIVVEVRHLVAAGAPFVYAYYDGIDKIAHDKGLGEHFLAELAAADRLVGELCESLPSSCALCVTADHGQVEVRDSAIELEKEIFENVTMLSGEGRFRWLHANKGQAAYLLEACREKYSDVAWVRSRDEMIAEGWIGGSPSAEITSRYGDVALVARSKVAFFDPADTGELRLIARHGSATEEEMLVPFLTYVP